MVIQEALFQARVLSLAPTKLFSIPTINCLLIIFTVVCESTLNLLSAECQLCFNEAEGKKKKKTGSKVFWFTSTSSLHNWTCLLCILELKCASLTMLMYKS